MSEEESITPTKKGERQFLEPKLKKHLISDVSRTCNVFPTPAYTPDIKQLTTQAQKRSSEEGKSVIVPAFTSKRSFDVFSVPSTDDQSNILRDSKRIKISNDDFSDSEDEQEEHIDHNDNDSEASTEVASHIDGDFYHLSAKSETEHSRQSLHQTLNSCLTPERPKGKREIIEDLDILVDFQKTINEIAPHAKTTQDYKSIFSTPETKATSYFPPKLEKRRQDSFTDHNAEVLEAFDPSHEVLLTDKYGKKFIKQMKPYDQKSKPSLLDKLLQRDQDYQTDEESDDSTEARLIQEALHKDTKQGLDSMGGFFARAQNEARLDNIIERKFDLPVYSAEPEDEYAYIYDSSEEEEAYLQKLLKKHKPDDKKNLPTSPGTSSSILLKTLQEGSTSPAPEDEEARKELRLRNKKLMRKDDDRYDSYLNFGFTLSELSNLKKSKKILVFEDPKDEGSSHSD